MIILVIFFSRTGSDNFVSNKHHISFCRNSYANDDNNGGRVNQISKGNK